jgi:ABC-type Fe3+/spermidine/putrescine transport system ATPase subunit
VQVGSGLALAGQLTDTVVPAVGGEVTLAVRPESVRLSSADSDVARDGRPSLAGRVKSNTYLGDQHEYRVEVPGLGEFVARSQPWNADEPGRTFQAGEAVHIGWHESAALVLTS